MKTIPMIMIGLTIGCQSEKNEEVTVPTPAPMIEEAPIASVTSADGTTIAFETAGQGPALVLVGGALSHRLETTDPLVAELAKTFTVYTYDRRGRGDSTNALPYAVDREIEDLGALIKHAGGSAFVYGVSSGGALALQAGATLGATKVTRLALYEPPYGQDAKAYAEQKKRVTELVKSGVPGTAAEYFLTAIGMPRDALEGMKRSPEWAAIRKTDYTLVYDYAVLDDGTVPVQVARTVQVPTLVMNGSKSLPFMQPTADRIAKLVPLGERKVLAGQTHQADAKVVAPVLVEFFTRATPRS